MKIFLKEEKTKDKVDLSPPLALKMVKMSICGQEVF